MSRDRPRPDVRLTQPPVIPGAYNSALTDRAIGLLQYHENILAGAAQHAASSEDAMKCLATVAWGVVRIAKADLLEGLLKIGHLEEDFPHVPALRMAEPAPVPDPATLVDGSAPAAETEAELLRRQERAARAIDDLLASTLQEHDLQMDAARQTAADLLKELWQVLSDQFTTQLPPSLAYLREQAEPFASFNEALSPPWSGTRAELEKAGWVIHMLVTLLKRVADTAASQPTGTINTARVELRGYVTLPQIWQAYRTLTGRQKSNIKMALQYFKERNPLRVNEITVLTRPGAKARKKTVYSYPADVVMQFVEKAQREPKS